MAKVIIVGGGCEGRYITKETEECHILESKEVTLKTCSHKDLSDALIRLGNTVNKLRVSFDELSETQKAFNSNETLPEPKSKYINKPRHNFKRR